MEIKLNGRYHNRFDDFILIRSVIPKGTIAHDHGYRFKDANGLSYYPNGKWNKQGESSFDLVREVTDRTIDQMPFNEIEVGAAVMSFTGNRGKIVQLESGSVYMSDTPNRNRQMVVIAWEDKRKLDRKPAYLLDAVRYLGHDTTTERK